MLSSHTGHVKSGNSASQIGIGPERVKPILTMDKIISLSHITAGINIGTGCLHMAVNHYTAVYLYASI
jgi:hypothetical protein